MMPKSKFQNFVKSAIKHPGALSKKAKAKGMTIAQYCSQSNLTPESVRQCNFWKNFLTGRKKTRSNNRRRATTRRA